MDINKKGIVLTIKNAVHNNSDLAKGALFSIYSFINKGFNFLLLLVLANFITPVEYGYLSLFTTVTMVIGYFIAFSTEGYFTISYFDEGVGACKKVFSNIFYLSFTVLATLLLSFIFAKDPISKILSLPDYTIVLGVISVFFNVFFNTFLAYFRIKEKVFVYGVISCSNALLNFVLSILLVKTLQYGWEGRVFSISGCSVVYGLVAILFFLKGGFFKRFDSRVLKKMLFWGIPLIPHLAANFLKQGCDRYIINYFHSTEDVGIFSFSLTLTTIITMIGFGFNESNSVSIFKICGDHTIDNGEKKIYLSKQRKKFLILFLLCTLFTVALCALFIPFLLPKYVDSLRYLPFLSIYGLLVCYYLIYTNYLFFYKKTKNLMYITFGSSILHLLLSLLLTRYSLYLTSVIYCVSQALVVILVRNTALKTLNKDLS